MSAFTDRFGHRLLETVQFAPRTTTDADRIQAYGVAVSVPAYIERFPRMTRDATGREVLAHATIIVDITPTIEPTAQVTMPDGTHPLILNVARYAQLIPHQEISIAAVFALLATLINGSLARAAEPAIAPPAQVIASEQMTVNARGLAEQLVTTGTSGLENVAVEIPAQNIDASRHWLEMSGIDAVPVTTEVVEFQSRRNGTESQFISNSVSEAGRPIEESITMRIDGGSPTPAAVIILADLPPKAGLHRSANDRTNGNVGTQVPRGPQSHVMCAAITQLSNLSLTSNDRTHSSVIPQRWGCCE